MNNKLKQKIMKKTLLIIAILFTSVTLYAKTPLEKLKKLADKVECEHKEYTEKDWEKIAKEYSCIVEEFNKKENTKEDLKEFGRQRGRIKGYMTKKNLNKFGKKVEKFANELSGGVEGFLETIETIIEE